MVDIIARIIAQKNNTSIVSQDGFRWTKQQVLDLETIFKNLMYTSTTEGQEATNRLILSLKKVVALSRLDVSYVGEKIAGKTLNSNDFIVKLIYDTSIFPNSGIPAEETISDGFSFTPQKLNGGVTRITIMYGGKTSFVDVNVDPQEYTGPSISNTGVITDIQVDGFYVTLTEDNGFKITWR